MGDEQQEQQHGQQRSPGVSPEAVAGLARQVDELARRVGELDGAPARLDDLAGAVADLAETVTKAVTSAAPSRPAPTPAPSWLMAPEDPEQISQGLDALCGWLHRVYLRYGDAVGLPECWLWHPEVVEELLWLQTAWLVAYQGKTASVSLAGDWHDRQRPGVVRRIRVYAGSCSRERHQTRVGWSGAPRGPIPVPGVDASASIAAWWATARDHPAPEPPLDPARDRADQGAGPGPAGPYPPGPVNGHRPYPPGAAGNGHANGHGAPDGRRW